MLTDLFQSSDSIYFMFQGANKLPIGGYFATSDYENEREIPQYFAINPIDRVTNRNIDGKKHPRASINVTAFRNFLFEMDGLTLEQQTNLLRFIQSKVNLAQVTFSGSNSLHAIISVADTLPFQCHTENGIAQYSQAWRALNALLTELSSEFLGAACPSAVFDPSCKDPSRLSRTPGAIRPDTNTVQSPLEGFGGLVDSDFVLGLMSRYGFNEVVMAPKVEQVSEMDTKLLRLRLLYPENIGLRSKIAKADQWAASEHMYPAIFQLTLWLIDSMGAPLPATLELLRSEVFPALKKAGYPRNPEIAVMNAYIWKGLL
jgi:hypothetical protein